MVPFGSNFVQQSKIDIAICLYRHCHMRLNEQVLYILARRPHEAKSFYSGSKENLIQTQMLLLLELLLELLLLLLLLLQPLHENYRLHREAVQFVFFM